MVVVVSVGGSGKDESEDSEVLPQRVDGVTDDGDVAATGAGEGSVGGSSKHSGKTLLAEAMAALKKEWDPLFVVVARLADGTRGNFHFDVRQKLNWTWN